MIESSKKFKDIIDEDRIKYELGINVSRHKISLTSFPSSGNFPYFQVVRTGILYKKNNNDIHVMTWDEYDKII